MNEMRIPYQPKIKFFALTVLIFGFSAWLMIYIAVTNTNEQDLIISCALAGLCLFFMFYTVTCYIRSTRAKKSIIILESSIILPKNFYSSVDYNIRFDNIIAFSIQDIPWGVQRLTIIYHPGRKASVVSSLFPNKQEFEQFVTLFEAKLRKHGDIVEETL